LNSPIKAPIRQGNSKGDFIPYGQVLKPAASSQEPVPLNKPWEDFEYAFSASEKKKNGGEHLLRLLAQPEENLPWMAQD
jgi:hypothetical protein